MILTKQQHEDFTKAAEPMIKFLNELNTHPYLKVIIDLNSAEFLEAICGIKNEEHLRD